MIGSAPPSSENGLRPGRQSAEPPPKAPCVVVWEARAPWDANGNAMPGGRLVWLPHGFPGRGDGGAGIDPERDLGWQSLSLGILVARHEPPPQPGQPATAEELRVAFTLAARELGADSPGDLCCNAAAFLRGAGHWDLALGALEQVVEWFPESDSARGDYIVSLYEGAIRGLGDPLQDLFRAAGEFTRWREGEPSARSNEVMVFFSGIAAMTYHGLGAERDAAVARSRRLLEKTPWLVSQVRRLRTVPAGDLEAVLPTNRRGEVVRSLGEV